MELLGLCKLSARLQNILGQREIGIGLEAKLRCILDRGINHLVGQFRRALLRLGSVEKRVDDVCLIYLTRDVHFGQRVFEAQAVIVDYI